MALSPNINNLEKDKFKDVSGETAVRVSVVETVGGGGGGDATAANQVLQTTQLTAINANTDNLPTALGQTTMAASLPVVIASNQSAVPVSGSVTITQGGNDAAVNINNELSVSVDNSVLPNGAATETTLGVGVTALQVMDDWDESDRAKVNPIAGQAGVAANAGSVSALTQRVVHGTGATPTLANVATSTANATILAANTSALTRSIHNDSTANLLIKFGATASATSFITKIPPGITLFFDQGDYNGQVDGLLESGTGTARTSVVTA